MAITISASKTGRVGRPAVDITYDPGTKLEDILAAQQRVFADKKLATKIGFKFHPGCYSGLDLDIRQKYEQIVQG